VTGGSGGDLPQGEAKRSAVRAMFDAIAPRYDLVNRVMTFGLDVRWRHRSLRALDLRPGSLVLDLACGTGDFCRALERGGHRPVGVDLSWGMLASARTAAPLVQGDLLALPLRDASAEAAVCGFALRNLVGLTPFLAELARVVRPGGRVALLDAATPAHPVLRWGHGVYFGRVVPLIGGALSDRAAYRYLPRSLSYLPQPPELVAMMEGAGFTGVRRVALSGGSAQLYLGTRHSP
jgi:demethylmenaquinone methyltransferase/2-methoxy-6-polyprenyl-1,4-benzoquinol methylase